MPGSFLNQPSKGGVLTKGGEKVLMPKTTGITKKRTNRAIEEEFTGRMLPDEEKKSGCWNIFFAMTLFHVEHLSHLPQLAACGADPQGSKREVTNPGNIAERGNHPDRKLPEVNCTQYTETKTKVSVII